MEVFIFGRWWTSHQSLTQRSTYFQIMYFALERWTENPQSNIAWEDRLTWFTSSPEYRALDRIDGEPMEFEWNIFPGFTTLQLCSKVQELLSRIERTIRKFHWTDNLQCRFSTTSHGVLKTIKKSASQVLNSFLSKQRDFQQDRTWTREKVVFYQWRKSTRWMGQNGREDDGDIRRKRDIQSSEPRVHYP